MNMLRIWGEGVLPPDSFYEECVAAAFASGRTSCSATTIICRATLSSWRTAAPRWKERCAGYGTIPPILLWCGGNEQYLWASSTDVPAAKREVFERLLPEACRRLDPTRLFHISSPYGGPTGNWPLEGDWHDYTTINDVPEAAVPLFGSEVLRVSVPSLTSMRRFLSEEELWPPGFDPAIRKPGQAAWPPAWAYHSTGIATWYRVGAIHEYCDPASAEDLIRVIGTAHGEYLRNASNANVAAFRTAGLTATGAAGATWSGD